MRKILSLVAILLLCSMPAMVQEDSKTVQLSVTIVGGVYLDITPPDATWPAVALPTTVGDEFIPCANPQTVFVSYSLASGHKAKLFCMSDSDLDSGTNIFPIESYIRHTFTNGMSFQGFVPPADLVTEQEVWLSAGAGGRTEADLLIEFKNQTFQTGTYLASITYTLIDTV